MAGQAQLIFDPSGKVHYCIDSDSRTIIWSRQCGGKIYDCQNVHMSACYFDPFDGQLFCIRADGAYQNIDKLYYSAMSEEEFAQVVRQIFGYDVTASITREEFKLNMRNGALLPRHFPYLDALCINRTDYEIAASDGTWWIRFSRFENQPPCFCGADHRQFSHTSEYLLPLSCMTTYTYRNFLNVIGLTNTTLQLPYFIVFEDSEKRRGDKIVFDALIPSGAGEVKAEPDSGGSLNLSDLRLVHNKGPCDHVLPFIGRIDFDGKPYFAFQKYEIALSEIRWEDHTITQKIKIFEDIVLGLYELASRGVEDVELSPESVVNKHGVWLLYGLTVIETPRAQALFNLGKIILAGVGSLKFEEINNDDCRWMCNQLLKRDDRHWPELHHLASMLFERRLNAFEAKQHPVFRTEIEKLRFMCNLSDDLNSNIWLRNELEKSSHLVYASVEVGLVLHGDLVRAMYEYADYRTFGFNTVQGLIRMMRNADHHRKDILRRNPHLQSLFKTKRQLYNYFNERYPRLFIEAFRVVYDLMGAEYTYQLFEVSDENEAER